MAGTYIHIEQGKKRGRLGEEEQNDWQGYSFEDKVGLSVPESIYVSVS